MTSTYLILSDITTARATVEAVYSDAWDVVEHVEDTSDQHEVAAWTGEGCPAVGDRIYLGDVEIIADPNALVA